MTPCKSSDQGRRELQGGGGTPLISDLHKHLDKEFFGSREESREGSRGWSCEVAPMTNYQGPLTHVTTTLAMHCRHGGSERTLQRLREGGLEMDGAATLSELAAQCNRTDDRDRAEDILGSLVGLAGEDPLAALGALVALYPAMVGIARRLIVAGVTPYEADVDVIAVAYQRILELSDDPPRHVARAVIGGTWDRIRTSLKAQQRCALRQCRLEEADESAVESVEGSDEDRLTGILIDAVAAGVIGIEAARIISATRVEGRSVRSVACDLDMREPAVGMVRIRAERALIKTYAPKSIVRSPASLQEPSR